MTDKQKEIVKELREANLDFTGWYGPSCYETGLSDLTEDTPENAVYFTLHRNNVYDCEADCGERTAYDFYGEEYFLPAQLEVFFLLFSFYLHKQSLLPDKSLLYPH